MLELNREQRARMADKLPDAGNVALGALVFGQFLSDRPFSVGTAGLGILSWVLFMGLSVYLEKRRP
jgi:hypothetical protein